MTDRQTDRGVTIHTSSSAELTTTRLADSDDSLVFNSSKLRDNSTGSQNVSSLSEHNKSALTDHAAQENHMINWSKAMVIDREPVRFSRWIKEAVHIRMEGQHVINRDEGSCQLSTRLQPLS